MIRQYRQILTVAAALSLGCTSDPTDPSGTEGLLGPTLTAHVEAVAGGGADISLRVVNRSPRTYQFGSCTTWIEHRTDSGWVRLGDPDAPCPTDITLVDPWGEVTVLYRWGPGESVGSYRFRISFGTEEHPEVRFLRASNSFEWPL